MNKLAKVLYAFTCAIVVVPTLTLGGIEHFNAYSAWLILIGGSFGVAALVA